MNKWNSAAHALDYLARADQIPHRTEGEAVVLELVPKTAQRILDLGTGNGRLMALLKIDRPQSDGVALDFSPTMLEAARERFADDATVEVVEHNFDHPLPDLGQFDVIVSSFAIHHVSHNRKRSLYQEIGDRLTPGGLFCNLEHVSSSTPELHAHFMYSIGYQPGDEDPSNKLLDLETQLQWLRDIGLTQVDCYWKWLEMALMVGIKPDPTGQISVLKTKPG
jgi:SAM-dependent methyltransferase